MKDNKVEEKVEVVPPYKLPINAKNKIKVNLRLTKKEKFRQFL
jgi:hypothetical protein